MAANLRQLYLNLSQRRDERRRIPQMMLDFLGQSLVKTGSATPQEIVWRNPKTKNVSTTPQEANVWEGDACNVEIGFVLVTNAKEIFTAVYVPLSLKQDEMMEYVMSVDGTAYDDAAEATAAVARHAEKQIQKMT